MGHITAGGTTKIRIEANRLEFNATYYEDKKFDVKAASFRSPSGHFVELFGAEYGYEALPLAEILSVYHHQIPNNGTVVAFARYIPSTRSRTDTELIFDIAHVTEASRDHYLVETFSVNTFEGTLTSASKFDSLQVKIIAEHIAKLEKAAIAGLKARREVISEEEEVIRYMQQASQD
jgi:hypothetical protein